MCVCLLENQFGTLNPCKSVFALSVAGGCWVCGLSVCVCSESVKAHLSSAQTGVVTGSAKWPSMCRKSHFLNGCLSLYVHLIEIFPGLQRPANKIALLRHSLFPPHAQLIPIFFPHLFWTNKSCKLIRSIFLLLKVILEKVNNFEGTCRIQHATILNTFCLKNCKQLSWKYLGWREMEKEGISLS